MRSFLSGIAAHRREAYIEKLIIKMNSKASYFNSSRTPAWRAYRKAEKLKDPEYLPIIKAYLERYPGKEYRDQRHSAYFIMGHLLRKMPDAEYIRYYIACLEKEDSELQQIILLRLGHISIPREQSMDAVIELAGKDDWRIRWNAIYALGSQNTERCKEVLRAVIALEDHKTYRDDIITAQAAIMKIADQTELELIEKNLSSKSKKIRESAEFVVNWIREHGESS